MTDAASHGRRSSAAAVACRGEALDRADLFAVLDMARPVWKDLRGARIFLTGATGFFGSWLVETFCLANEELGLGAEMVCLTRDRRAFARRFTHLGKRRDLVSVQGDVRRFRFPRGPFSHMIHAATSSAKPVAPLEEFDTIVEGTRRALEFAREAGVRAFLFTSSGAVYGRRLGELRVTETYRGGPDPCQPQASYDEAKRAAELLCVLHSAKDIGLQAKIARCFSFVGPGLPLDAHFAIGNFIRDALAGGELVVEGDGTPVRSYMYASDLTAWLWTILVRGVAGRPYNVGSEHAVSIEDLARTVALCFDTPPAVTIRGTPVQGAHADRFVPSSQRARTELGLEQKVDLVDAVRRTIAWHRRHKPAQSETESE